MDKPNLSQSNSDQVEREVKEIQDVAHREGVELNAPEARAWILAVSQAEREAPLVQDAQAGIFGHRISLLDFDQQELDYFRRLARQVRTVRHPNTESAIAIAGSSAQGKVQLFPGDNDFYERLNIHATSEVEARRLLNQVVRATALRAFAESDIVLLEVDLGVFPSDVFQNGKQRKAGHSIEWTPTDVLNGFMAVQDANGQPLTIKWEEVQAGIGFVFLSWIVADRTEQRIGLASNVIDATWEAPDGNIIALDGSIDPFFQEIYLEAEAAPVFTKVVQHADPNAMDMYIQAMRAQVIHYSHDEVNFGKVAKRLYNLFRLTDRLEAAAYLRELFDEPAARLYQVTGLLEAADAARDPQSGIDHTTVIHQIDHIIRAVKETDTSPAEVTMLSELRRLRENVLRRKQPDQEWRVVLDDVNEKCLALVNDYFRERLVALPQIKEFLQELNA